MTAPTATCLRPDLELGPALDAVVERGFAQLTAALARGFLPGLQDEIERGPFEVEAREVGQVRQELEGYVAGTDSVVSPLAASLRDELGRRVRTEGAAIEGLGSFAPNEIHVQRYPSGSVGITPHRDGTRFRPLIAVFTTRGRARFTIHLERHAPPVAAWELEPGDLVLLRGPGLAGVEDGRPFHAVSGPIGPDVRYSVSVRHNAAAHHEPSPPG